MTPRSSLPKFNITDSIEAVCRDMTAKVPALQHIDMNRVAVRYCHTRNNKHTGVYATMTPLRFQNGERIDIRRGRRIMLPRYLASSGQDALYLLSVYLPRFYAKDFRDRLNTLTHELWHISPRFNGDIRRFPGRCFIHGKSQKDYDAVAEQLVMQWLATNPDPNLYAFLQCSLQELWTRYCIVGRVFKNPKIITLP